MKKYMVNVGDIIESKYHKGLFFEILHIDRRKNNRYTIKFLDEYKYTYTLTKSAGSILNGQVRNPYSPTVFGVGYIGVGVFSPTTEDGRKHTKVYDCWKNMMMRGYSDRYKKQNPTYESVCVCKEWHNFQNFAKWYKLNYNLKVEQVIGETLHLDKDLYDSKEYSPNTCIFIPKKMNSFMSGGNKKNTYGNTLELGVRKEGNSYSARIVPFGETNAIHLGSYKTLDEAVLVRINRRLVETDKARNWMLALGYPKDIVDRIK